MILSKTSFHRRRKQIVEPGISFWNFARIEPKWVFCTAWHLCAGSSTKSYCLEAKSYSPSSSASLPGFYSAYPPTPPKERRTRGNRTINQGPCTIMRLCASHWVHGIKFGVWYCFLLFKQDNILSFYFLYDIFTILKSKPCISASNLFFAKQQFPFLYYYLLRK